MTTWVEFLKDFAAKNKMKYNEAMKSSKAKTEWAKLKKKEMKKEKPMKKDMPKK